MPEFIPDKQDPLVIDVGDIFIDLIGSKYRVEAITEDHFDIRCFYSTMFTSTFFSQPGITRYLWTEPFYLTKVAS